MNVGLASLQSSLINYSMRQHVFKPIALLVAGIALAIFSGLFIAGTILRCKRDRRGNIVYSRHFQEPINPPRPQPINPPRPQPINSPSPRPMYYGSKTIYVNNEAINSKPYDHIKDLARSIRSTNLSLFLNVKFKKLEEVESAGDGGGPTRQYFNLLFKSLKTFFSSEGEKSGDFILHTNDNITLLVPQGKPTTDHIFSIFYDIGTVMMYVYFSSKSPLIGPIFHEAIFSAILSLDDQEIDTPYVQLSNVAKVKMCKALIHAQQASGANDFKTYLPILEFLEKGDQFTEEDLTDEVKYYYGVAEYEWESASKSPREFLLPGGDDMTPPALNVEAIMENAESKSQFLNKCLRHLLSHNKASSLGDIELTFFPIHTMAKAMKEISKEEDWKKLRSQVDAVKELQRKIQGVQDRELLVSRIEVYNSTSNEVVNNQLEWIKTWILDPATTDTLIEGLLTFWTGSSYIDWDKVQKILVYSEARGALPGAGTCGRTLYVSNSLSKENTRGELGLCHNHTIEGYYQVLNKIAGEYSTIYTDY